MIDSKRSPKSIVTWKSISAIYPEKSFINLKTSARTLECRLALFKESTVSMFLSVITKFPMLVKEMTFSRHLCDRSSQKVLLLSDALRRHVLL
jgi:hypothetical protein